MAALNREALQTSACLDPSAEDRSKGLKCEFDSPLRTKPGATTAEFADGLRCTIESQIIPRLMLASRSRAMVHDSLSVAEAQVTTADVRELTQLLLGGRTRAAVNLVASLVEDGVARPRIMLDLFAPAAKRLGELWESDACTFTDVTIGMGVLQHGLRLLDDDDAGAGQEMLGRRSILLMPAAGEQHVFPVQVLDIFFRRAGWAVDSELVCDMDRVCKLVKKRRFDAIGLSISRDSLLDRLSCDIQRLRRASHNRSIVVLVGGRVFSGQPELVARVGADATARDAPAALRIAEQLVPVAAMTYR